MKLMTRKLLITGAAVVILGGLAAGCSPASQSANNPLPPATAQVARTTLVETRAVSGTLGYGDPAPVSATGNGTLTWIAPVGATVERGEPLFEVDGRPVVALYGSQPLYQTLSVGVVGADSLALAQVEAKAADARLALKKAQEALDAVKNKPAADDIAGAQHGVDSAKVSLVNAEGDLALTRKEWDSKVKAAQEAADAAAEAYAKPFSKWLDIVLSAEERSKHPDSLLASWEADLASIFARAQRLTEAGEDFPADDPATRWNEAVTFSWLKFYPGQILATCANGKAPYMGACVHKEMTDAWDAYQKAKDSLDTAQIQAAKAISGAENALSRTQQSLATAEKDLAKIEAGSDPLEVDRAEKQLVLAQVNLDVAERDLAKLKGSADPQVVRQLEENLAELGYAGFAVNGIYDAATAAAVRAWQADLGLPVTGTVEPGQVVFVPGPVRIAEHSARVGDAMRGAPVLSYTGTDRLVTVQLRVADQALAVEGRTVPVKVPGRGTVEGEVSRIGTVVRNGMIEVIVTIPDQEALGPLTSAPVDVDFVSQERGDVLAVPVVALLALAEGGYGVEIVTGNATRIVPVKTGMFATGRVEISGEGIAEGVTVGVPR